MLTLVVPDTSTKSSGPSHKKEALGVVVPAVKVTVGLVQLMGLVLPMVTTGAAVFSVTLVDLPDVQPFAGLVAVNV